MPERLDVMLVVGSTTGGIGAHVRTLAERLHALGHGVTVVAPASTTALFSWESTGARLVAAPIGSARPSAAASSLRTIASSARGADVVHAHGTRAAALAAAAGVEPLIATWHNTAPTRLRRRVAYPIVERLAARRTAVTLVVSADLAA